MNYLMTTFGYQKNKIKRTEHETVEICAQVSPVSIRQKHNNKKTLHELNCCDGINVLLFQDGDGAQWFNCGAFRNDQRATDFERINKLRRS